MSMKIVITCGRYGGGNDADDDGDRDGYAAGDHLW